MTVPAPLALDPLTDVQPLPSPNDLRHDLAPSTDAARLVRMSRDTIREILACRDDRLLVVVGPCSVHDAEQARTYAERLAGLAHELRERLHVVMRVYVDKPRTSLGWRGFLLDPDLDGRLDLAQGLRRSRELMRDVLELGVPVATEILEPLAVPYLADLLSWAAVGARTTESQTHRVLASALAAPVGFKNGTDGNVRIALDAVRAAASPQVHVTVGPDGRAVAARTPGNVDGHVILRGGHGGPNHSAAHVAEVEATLVAAGLPTGLVVDCSHGNSGYDPARQAHVLRDVLAQRRAGPSPVRGVMLESNLQPGKQPLAHRRLLAYGVSVTDACVGWDETEALLREAAGR